MVEKKQSSKDIAKSEEKKPLTQNRAKKVRKYNHFTQQKRNKFLRALEKTGNLNSAAAHVGVPRVTVYALMKKNERFKERVQMARDKATGSFEEEAVRRGKDGVEEPVYYRGEKVDTVRKFSDNLLIKLLEASDPERYGKRSNVSIDHNITVNDVSAKDKLAAMLDIPAIEGEYKEVEEDDED